MPRAFSLNTARAAGEHLGWVAPALGVERAPDRHHRGQVLGGEQLGHEFHLFDSDPMFAGNAASHRDAFIEDLVAGQQDPFDLVLVAFVKEQDRMDVAVAGMEDIGDPQVVPQTNLSDESQNMGQFGAGTTPSCVQYVGLRRPIAPKADLRLFHMATYSGSLRVRQVIDRPTEPPWAWTISLMA